MLDKIDWSLLRLQKQWLMSQEDPEGMSLGLIHLIDAVQDHAVDSGSATEQEVFG
jgi:hypothetical protein